jgi:DNA modification methylase
MVFDFPDGKVLIAEALSGLRTLPDASVNTCVTSPPYFKQRDYGTSQWLGGDKTCDHVRPTNAKRMVKNTMKAHTRPGNNPSTWNECGKCGAIRKDLQIGLESSPEIYIQKLVAVFREVRRVLTNDGTLWCNIGDSYANLHRTSTKKQTAGEKRGRASGNPYGEMTSGRRIALSGNNIGLKDKDLIGVPFRLALALQADGWYLRSVIIWQKLNARPESTKDRPTTSHEYILLLSKRKNYYYNYAATLEPAEYDGRGAEMYGGSRKYQNTDAMPNGNEYTLSRPRPRWNRNEAGERVRNSRTVWTFPTEPFGGEHYAAFPEELPRRCITAGCPPNGTVLDPFAGSGTTLAVARLHSRKFIGIEINPKHLKHIKLRLRRALCAEKPQRLRIQDDTITIPMFEAI